jgi:hypothetical protein
MLDAGLKMPMLDETTDTGYWIKPKCRYWMLDGLYPVSSIQYPASSIQHPVSSIQYRQFYPVSSDQRQLISYFKKRIWWLKI